MFHIRLGVSIKRKDQDLKPGSCLSVSNVTSIVIILAPSSGGVNYVLLMANVTNFTVNKAGLIVSKLFNETDENAI